MERRIHDAVPLRPPEGERWGRGLTFAVLLHGLILVSLGLNVKLRSSEPEAVQAELWASVPPPPAVETPPPPPPAVLPPKPAPVVRPPEPTPREADIAIERERQREQERRKREEEAQRQKKLALQKQKEEEAERQKKEERARREQAEKKEAALKEQQRREEQARLKEKQEQQAKREQARKEAQARREAEERREQEAQAEALRQAQLKRALGQAGAGTSTSAAAGSGSQGPSAGYAGRVRASVRPNVVFSDTVSGNPLAEVEVRAAPDGTILGVRLIRPSGHAGWDDAVVRAVQKTVKMPRDTDGRVPSPMILEFRPKDF